MQDAASTHLASMHPPTLPAQGELPCSSACAPEGAAPTAALPQPQALPAWCTAGLPAGRRQSANEWAGRTRAGGGGRGAITVCERLSLWVAVACFCMAVSVFFF